MRRIDRLKGMPVLSPLVLRYGITFVYLWFGTTQLMNPSGWTGWIPQWVAIPE